ncbi:hypothetical protein [Mycobacterium paraseoulense]|uniref:hypothetical protein n=1 Tax=Mycobacterium paraseoulense TaxID=590652 RepID=UPI001E2AD652|nr:hypothetical protein [Mycobacterium paraseoulense]
MTVTVPATEPGTVAPVVGAKVIVLESHPAWISAQRHAAELVEAMRRHPSSMGRPAHRTPTRIRRPRP